jgi:N-dimethylarginine dimethylaminohydrolase
MLINRAILMSDAEHFSTKAPINPYYDHDPVIRERAIAELNAVKQLLIEAGVNVTSVSSPFGCQDGIYTANWALVRSNRAVLSSLPNARKCEEEYAEKILTSLGKKVVHIPDGLKFSGQGDALTCGNYLFCGSNYRSDPAAQKFAADYLGYDCIQLQTIPLLNDDGSPVINTASGWLDSYFYDIDMALAIIKMPVGSQHGLIAYCPDAFTPDSRELLASFKTVDKITVSIDEARNGFATNLVSTGETIIMSAHAPKLSAALRSRGLNILTPKITEISKGGGYIRCITLTID